MQDVRVEVLRTGEDGRLEPGLRVSKAGAVLPERGLTVAVSDPYGRASLALGCARILWRFHFQLGSGYPEAVNTIARIDLKATGGGSRAAAFCRKGTCVRGPLIGRSQRTSSDHRRNILSAHYVRSERVSELPRSRIEDAPETVRFARDAA